MMPRKNGKPKMLGGKKATPVKKFYMTGMITADSLEPKMPGRDFISDRMNPTPVMPRNPYPNY